MSEHFITTVTLKTDKVTTTFTYPSTDALPPQVRGVYPGHGCIEVAFTVPVIENGTLVPSRNVQVEPRKPFTGTIPPKTSVTINVR